MGITVVKIRDKYYVAVRWEGKRRHFRAGDTEEEADKIANDIRVLFNLEGEKALRHYGRKKRKRTIAEYGAPWLVELESTSLKPATILSYKGNFEVHILPAFGSLEIDGLTYSLLKRFVIEKVDSGLSKNTVRLIVGTIRAMLNEARDDGLIETNPAQGLGKFYRSASNPRSEPNPFERDELQAILDGSKVYCPMYVDLILALACTGMRLGEAIALKWKDLDFRSSTIHVRRNLPSNPSLNRIETPKTKHGRRKIAMPPDLSHQLRKLLAARRQRAFARGRQDQIPEWVFLNTEEKLVEYSVFRTSWRRLLARVKVEGESIRYRSPGQLRHTWASHRLSEGKSLLWVSKQLGHSNPSITLKFYARWIPEQGENEHTGVKEGLS